MLFIAALVRVKSVYSSQYYSFSARWGSLQATHSVVLSKASGDHELKFDSLLTQ